MVSVKLGALKIKNPVMTASGTFGSGKEYSKFYDLSELGAVVCKTITLNKRDGNPPPRIADTPYGMLNAIGLENKGVEYFIEDTLPFIKQFDTACVVSIAGNNPDEYKALAERLNKCPEVHAIEVNMSCPNVTHGTAKGLFCQDNNTMMHILKEVKAITDKPVFAKISPAVTDITVTAKAVKDSGADAVSLINTYPAMGVDLKTRRPLLGNITGGLSGPAIKPIALKMVWEVYKSVDIPIIAMGGIMCADDALEFILCGATAVQIGTANFVNPMASAEIARGVEKYFKENNLSNIDDLRGKLKI
ncbi:dihydroorotate dehydrogenase (NAD+) catalytic subunit [Parelusimicrobium proximum]|uniref:dihydroorotate dehydrogenase n=1 Tax=Parelusimicrobium proximum TaxID=3228953 RepID=UPI003D172582